MPPHMLSHEQVRHVASLIPTLRVLDVRCAFRWVASQLEGPPHPTLCRLSVREVYSEASSSCLELLTLGKRWQSVEILDIDHAGHSCWSRLRPSLVRVLVVTHYPQSDVILALPNVGDVFHGIGWLLLSNLDNSHAKGFAKIVSGIAGTLEVLQISFSKKDGRKYNICR